MPPFTAEDLTVVIPTRARWSILARTLDGLAQQTVAGFEIVVVVDGDDPAVPELPGVRVLVKPHGGPGAARNAGVEASERSLVLFLGDDMIPTPGLVERHLERHRREPADEVAVLGHVDWHPELADRRLARWLDWSHTQFDYGLITGDDAGFGRFFSCNVSLKRALFDAAGGFDPDFVYYYEDLDLGWRLDQHGLVLRYEPAALAHHLHSYDWPAVERRFEGIARGERLMQRKHPDFEPWFAAALRAAQASPRRSLVWPLLVDHVPAGRVRQAIQRRAGLAYSQRLAPVFFHAWQADLALEELQAYLGEDFDETRLVQHRHLVDEEEAAAPDELSFYRTSEAYLYDLTAFATWPTKVPYLDALTRFVPPGASVLDFGCGIGTDGLRLLADGYRVAFADFDNPSTRYLKWRLERRGLTAAVHDVDGEVPGGFDAAFSFDVIEHVADPWAFLAELEDRAAVVAVNLLEDDPDDTHLHKPLPIQAMLDHAASAGLLWYRRYHGRSHLVIYRSPGAGSGAQDASRTAVRSFAQRRFGGHRPVVGMADLDRVDAAAHKVVHRLRRLGGRR
jgi:GT2 family glycosyltransferase/SAM-dependent methyltransferase